MVTKKRPESEREQPDSGHYLANERACQGAFSSHPAGMVLPAPGFLDALGRGFNPDLRSSRRPASGRRHVTALVGSQSSP